jgi:hypothetical protein
LRGGESKIYLGHRIFSTKNGTTNINWINFRQRTKQGRNLTQLGAMLALVRYHIFRDSATNLGRISFDKDWIGEQTSKLGAILTHVCYHIFRDSATNLGGISFDKD